MKIIYQHLFLIYIILIGVTCLAQESDPTPIGTQEPQAITIDNFVSEIENLSSAQDDFSELKKSHSLKSYQEKYEELSEPLSKIRATAKKQIEQKIAFSTDELNKIEAPLLNMRSSLESASTKIRAVAEDFSLFASKFKILEERWQKAQSAFKGKNASKELLDKFLQGLENIRKSKVEAQQDLDRLIVIQTQYAEGIAKVRESRELLASARMEFQEALFKRETTSMLSAKYWKHVLNFNYKNISKTFNQRISSAKAYIISNSNRSYLLLILFVLVAFLVRTVGRSSFAEASFKSLYDNPVLLTIVTSLIISHFVFYDANSDLHGIINLLLVFPVVLFLTDILGKQYSDIISGIGLLYVIGELRAFTRGFVICDKLVLLFQLLLAIYFSYKFTSTCRCVGKLEEPKEATESEANKTLLALGQVGKFFQIIFAAAALFLLLGFYRLVLFVEDNLFNALYLALILFVVYKLCYGFGVFFIRSRYFQHIRVIQKNTEKFIKSLDRLLIISAVLFWIYRGMIALGIEEKTFGAISNFLSAGFQVGDLKIQVGGIILAIFFLLAGGTISRGIRAILEEEVYGRRQLDAGTRNTLDTGVHYVVLILSVLAAVGSLGIGLQNIAIIAGALSVGIGFGLQNIVNNFVSGIILLFERPIKVGDLILVGDTLGNVSRIGIRSSTIKTLDAAEIIIPNGTLVTENVINWTLTNRRARISVNIGVAYGTDLDKCSEILLETIKAQEFILEYPAPDVLFREFADSSLNFEARGWIKNVQDRPKLLSQLSLAIHNALRDANISIPFPQRDVHIINES